MRTIYNRLYLHREYMQLVLFVSELEDLHMKTTINAFRRCNKEGLVKTLWRNHSHEPKVSYCLVCPSTHKPLILRWWLQCANHIMKSVVIIVVIVKVIINL